MEYHRPILRHLLQELEIRGPQFHVIILMEQIHINVVVVENRVNNLKGQLPVTIYLNLALASRA